MPSRKRLKAKARRAAKGGGDRRREEGAAATNDTIISSNQCNHGCPTIETGDICDEFANAYKSKLEEIVFEQKDGSLSIPNPYAGFSAAVRSAVRQDDRSKYESAWRETANLNRTRGNLLAWGTDLILKGKRREEVMSTSVAITILWLECGVDINEMPMLLIDDLTDDLVRETTKFYYKRLKDCDCLKEKWRQLRKQTKISRCDQCCKDIPRRETLICSRCWTAQFCSKACQVKHWPKHKSFCSKKSDKCQCPTCRVLTPGGSTEHG